VELTNLWVIHVAVDLEVAIPVGLDMLLPLLKEEKFD
jgi:hypothetical protein